MEATQYKDQADQFAQEEANEEERERVNALPFYLKPRAVQDQIRNSDDYEDFSGASEGDR